MICFICGRLRVRFLLCVFCDCSQASRAGCHISFRKFLIPLPPLSQRFQVPLIPGTSIPSLPQYPTYTSSSAPTLPQCPAPYSTPQPLLSFGVPAITDSSAPSLLECPTHSRHPPPSTSRPWSGIVESWVIVVSFLCFGV